jgi:hypothetical protein
MTYTIFCLASLSQRCLGDLLSPKVEIISLTRLNGLAKILIKCDAATAAKIAEHYHVSEV